MAESKATPWTKELVQQHAQTAVAVELFTLPFYFTVLTSIKDRTDPIYKTILSVCMEEMLHMELASNLCLALDTRPNFRAPQYGVPLTIIDPSTGKPVPILEPYDPATEHGPGHCHHLINAKLDHLDKNTLDTMLNIETPGEFEGGHENLSPNYPYSTIGELYDALYAGILQVGADQFEWNTEKQQKFWLGENFPQKISNLEQAKQAIDTIREQGEGKAMQPVPQPPFHASQFPIPKQYRLENELEDPDNLNLYSHFGRFISIQNRVEKFCFPEVYDGFTKPSNLEQTQALEALQHNFAFLLKLLNEIWDTGQGNLFEVKKADCEQRWSMLSLINLCQNCWSLEVIPQWSKPTFN